MRKSYFIISVLFCMLQATCLKSENSCFRYIELSKSMKNAIEDYGKPCHDNNMLLGLMYQSDKLDSTVFTLIEVDIYTFLASPTKYYSFHKGMVILIYNVEEKEYNPNAADIESFVSFLSNFDDSKTIVKCDWEKKELTVDERFHTRKLHFCDPPFAQYCVNNESIIRKRIFNGRDIDFPGYPERRYDVNIIYVEW